jgi:dihydrodipicolinate synthase/N-acetylneuraminate lyase
MSNRLQGVFTPNMVPLDSSGAINESELRRYIDWLIDNGIHGLYPNGSTGEFTRFTPEERRRIIRIVCDQTQSRVPILAGAAEANVHETLLACESCLEFGVRAVAIVAPFYYRLSSAAVYAYFREIALNTPIDITLYNIPAFASPIDVSTAQQLAEFPRIIGIKDSSGDIAHMLRMMAAIEPYRPDFVFLTGWEPAMVPMLAMGCHGGTFALSGVVPEVTRTLYSLTIAGQMAEARLVQMRLTDLFDRIVYGVDFPEGVRTAIELRGFQFGASRQPMGCGQQLDRGEVAHIIDRLLTDVDHMTALPA